MVPLITPLRVWLAELAKVNGLGVASVLVMLPA
jgi:hypothetical protein